MNKLCNTLYIMSFFSGFTTTSPSPTSPTPPGKKITFHLLISLASTDLKVNNEGIFYLKGGMSKIFHNVSFFAFKEYLISSPFVFRLVQ